MVLFCAAGSETSMLCCAAGSATPMLSCAAGSETPQSLACSNSWMSSKVGSQTSTSCAACRAAGGRFCPFPAFPSPLTQSVLPLPDLGPFPPPRHRCSGVPSAPKQAALEKLPAVAAAVKRLGTKQRQLVSNASSKSTNSARNNGIREAAANRASNCQARWQRYQRQ